MASVTVSVDTIDLNVISDLKVQVWTCNSTRSVKVAVGTLEPKIQMGRLIVKIDQGYQGNILEDELTGRRFNILEKGETEDSNSSTMNNVITHTIGNPRNYINKTNSDKDDLFTTGN